jgi:hypothetical protein
LQELEALKINSKNYGLLITAILTFGAIVTVLVGMALSAPLFGFVGLAIFWLGPLFFENSLRKPFTKKVKLYFSDSDISSEIYNIWTNALESKDEVSFSEIKSFKIMNSTKDDSSFLKLNLKNGKKWSYIFIGQKNDDSKTDVTEIVTECILKYNLRQDEYNRITLIPNFFVSKTGKFVIAAVGVLMISTLVLQIIFKPKSIPVSIITGFFFYILILAQRRQDKANLENFENRITDRRKM